MDQIHHVGHKCFQVHQLSESHCQPEGAARMRSKPRTISLSPRIVSICVDMMVALEFFYPSTWWKILTDPPCRAQCSLFSQKKSSVQDESWHFVYLFLWIFLPSYRDGLWSSCHCFCLLGANPHQDVTPGLRKRKQFQRIGDENLATWTRNQWNKKLRGILWIILSWSNFFLSSDHRDHNFYFCFLRILSRSSSKVSKFWYISWIDDSRLYFDTFRWIGNGKKRREIYKTQTNMENVDFTFGKEWKDHETSTNECYVFYWYWFPLKSDDEVF